VADLGDVVPLTVEIRDAAGALAAAGAITLTITLPDGTTATPTVTNPSIGRYQCDYPTTQVGRHSVRWVSTGLNSSAYADSFDVRPAIPAYILSMSDAKAALQIPAGVTTNDEQVRSMVEAVTYVIEDYRKDVVVRRTIVEPIDAQFDSLSSRRLVLRWAPVLSVTSIVRPIDGATWAGSDITVLDPNSGVIITYGTPFYASAFRGGLVATYVAGRSVIPANYVEAAKVVLKHLWEIQQTPGMGSQVFGDTISTGEAKVMTGLGYALPNRAAELLGGRGVFCA
jgi:hypothetical protein